MTRHGIAVTSERPSLCQSSDTIALSREKKKVYSDAAGSVEEEVGVSGECPARGEGLTVTESRAQTRSDRLPAFTETKQQEQPGIFVCTIS